MKKNAQTAIAQLTAQAEIAETRMKWAGAIGLLCQCAVHLGNGEEADDMRDQIEAAATDWCSKSGWTVRRTIHRIEVDPPSTPNNCKKCSGGTCRCEIASNE